MYNSPMYPAKQVILVTAMTDNDLAGYELVTNRLQTGYDIERRNAHQLASRIKDSEQTLQENGWEVRMQEIGGRRRIYVFVKSESVKA